MKQKINYFTLDNASNNEPGRQQICSYLPTMNLSFNPIDGRLQCFGHIVHPELRGFLRAENQGTFDSEIIFYEELNQESQEFKAWRRKGTFGKLYNILVGITRTPQGAEKFEVKVRQLLQNSKALP